MPDVETNRRGRRTSEPRASRQIRVQGVARRVVQRHERLFWNLVCRMIKTILGHVLEPERQGFGDAQAGGGQKAEERRVHQRPDRASRAAGGPRRASAGRSRPACRCGGSAARAAPTPQGIGRRNLVARILGPQRQGKASDRQQAGCAAAPATARAPPSRARAPTRTNASPCASAKATKLLSSACWTRNLKPRAPLQFHVPCQILAQHDVSPGQGCAICRSMMTSTLA